MITLNCLECGKILRVSADSAGRSCQCSYCGAKVSVPAQASGDTVDRSSGVAQVRRTLPPTPTRDTTRSILKRSPGWLVLPPLALLAGGGLALAWLNRPDGADVDARAVVVPKPDSAFAAPMFGPVNLSDASHVVFLLDSGDASATAWPELVRVTLASVWNLGPGREVQVGVWQAADGAPITPAGASSVSERREQAMTLLAGVRVGGTTHLLSALDAALERRPSDIVLVSGRASEFESVQAGEVLERVGNTGIRIHTIALGPASAAEGWRMISRQTGGSDGRLDLPSPAG